MKKIYRSLTFILVLLVVYIYLTFVFIPKSFGDPGGQKYYRGKGYMGEPTNSLEILAFGNSDLYCGFTPLYLYDQYGYTSYSCGVSKQNTRGVYNLLSDSLKYQQPKLIILETDCFYSRNRKENSKFNNFLMKSTFIFRNHSRWKNLKLKDFVKLPNYNERDFQKGYVFRNVDSDFIVKPYMGHIDDEQREFSEFNLKYINKIINICNENNLQILLVELPSATSWNYAKHNKVENFAKEKNIPFIDMNINTEEIGIIWDDHFSDQGNHLNCYGAKIATKYLGEYLNKNYNLTDQRNNPNYDKWNQDLKTYQQLF